ncbi:hypothetical protein T4E_191 [Trichinella pseudospiralis]|uniref:DUF5648 domain-containing protein n=1 Tax=Trichinella pseudospiralis TaxID=6337 RepID=A0A0V0Y3L1_TRIPS|nr:hypothetical protein T4E_191 [Trichinella pseudospiralis]
MAEKFQATAEAEPLSQLSLQQGTPKPFNDLGKVMMVSIHNTVRGDAPDQSNVQCLTNWDSTLESYAQNLANTCNRTAPANSPYGLAYSSEISEANITPQAFVETLGNSFSLFYNPVTNQCDEADRTDCNAGRQGFFANSTIQQRPIGTLCKLSITQNNLHSKTLLDALTQNYLVTSQSEINALSVQSRTNNLGAVGKIPLERSTSCPYLTPIYKLYAASATSNYYMIDSSLKQQRLTEGYTDQGIVGYAVPAQHLCNASVAIYEFYAPGNGIVQVAPSTAPGALAAGTPVPFSKAEKIDLFFNSDQVKCNVRFGIKGHCKFQWDASLEKYAQTIANSCSSIKMTNNSAIEKFSNLFYRNYDCHANISEDSLLKSHNQDDEKFWSEIEKLGCGRSICENGIFIVCAYLTENYNSIMHVSLGMNKKNFRKEPSHLRYPDKSLQSCGSILERQKNTKLPSYKSRGNRETQKTEEDD